VSGPAIAKSNKFPTCLDAFFGIYHGHESLFQPYTNQSLPIIHVYTFNSAEDIEIAGPEICTEISHYLTYPITLDVTIGKGERENTIKSETIPIEVYYEGKAKIWFVRKVSPKKSMYCASFRLPRDVAFRKVLKKKPSEEDEERLAEERKWMVFEEERPRKPAGGVKSATALPEMVAIAEKTI